MGASIVDRWGELGMTKNAPFQFHDAGPSQQSRREQPRNLRTVLLLIYGGDRKSWMVYRNS